MHPNIYTFDPTKLEWADYAAVQAWWGNLSGNELTRNSSGNTRPQSSQLAEPLWTDLGVKHGISVCELNSISKRKEKSAGRERMVEHSPKILASKEKPPPPPLVQENVTRSSSLLQV